VDVDRPTDPLATEDELFAAALGHAIKVIRTGLGMDRKRLAKAARLSYSYLAEIENGRKPASAAAQHAIARALGLSPSELLAAAEEWAARMGHGEPPLAAAEEMEAPRVQRAATESPGRELPGPDRGARARQQRWFHAYALPRRAEGPASEGGDASLQYDLHELRRLLPSLSPQDRARVLDLVRRLARDWE
jgi:transcriptional regulator with XRE-family HTH domain